MRKLNLPSLLRRATFGIGHLLFFLVLFPPSSLHSQPSISFDLDCSQGPGQARLEVLSPLGGDWSYAINDEGFQSSPLFTDIFPGNHILIVRNTSGDRDTVSYNANCGLEPFACGDCDASDGFYQVFGLEGELAALDLDEQEFKLLPNSPAGFGLNAMGINPLDSLAYGIKRSSPPELIVVDKSGRDVSLGNIELLPNRVYHAGDFDPAGYLHIKDNQTNRQVFAVDVKKSRVERAYSLSSTLYSADFAYNPIDGLFYGLNGSGRLYSFDPNSGLYSSIANTSMRRSFGAVYSDNSGRIWGIENATGNLYEVDLSSGDLTLVMTTTNSSRNDGFSCQNSFFNRTSAPVLNVECSSLPGRVNLRIIQPEGEEYEFKLNNGNFERTRYYENLLAGEYEVITRQPGNCVPDTTSIVLEPQYITNLEIVTTACDSFISPTGEIWFDSGTYQDTILNSMGCDSIITIDLTIESSSSIQFQEACLSYIWNGMTLDSSGVYEYLTTNAAGCDSLAQLDLTIVTEVDTSFSVVSCRPYPSPDGEETWTSSGVYIDTLVTDKDCDSIITIDLWVGDVMADWQLIDPTCPDQLTTDLQIDSITHARPHLMIRNQFDTIVISDFPTRISDCPEGSNSFVFLSSDSCISEEFTVDIERLQEPEIRILGPSEVDVCDPAASFRLETNMPGEVQWSAPASLSCDTCLTASLNPDSSGTIRVEFIAENECVATEAFFVQVNGIGDIQYFIPNVFSPNGDGINDYFTMFTGHGEVDQVELFEIYDRWGNRLFQRKNFFPSHESLGWDGSYQGSPLSPGVYVYHILYRYCDGSTHRIHGSVTLVR